MAVGFYVAKHVHFFFQAEDGIRDRDVTGVQTCALPIYQVRWEQAIGGLDRNRQRTGPPQVRLEVLARALRHQEALHVLLEIVERDIAQPGYLAERRAYAQLHCLASSLVFPCNVATARMTAL